MITGFQYKAALAITNITLKDLSNIIYLHRITLLRYKKLSNLEELPCRKKNLISLIRFFNTQNVSFPNQYSIKLNTSNVTKKITRFHLVVARAAIGMTQNELSKIIGVSYGTISLLESLNNTEEINTKTINNRYLIQFFERIGIIFKENYVVALAKNTIELPKFDNVT